MPTACTESIDAVRDAGRGPLSRNRGTRALQSLKKQVAALARSDVTDDAAHESFETNARTADPASYPSGPYADASRRPADVRPVATSRSQISSHSRLVGRLHHHPHQRLRARWPDEHPPAALERLCSRSTASQHLRRRAPAPRGPARARSPAAAAASPSRRGRPGRAPASASSVSSAAAVPSPGGHEAGVDDVARLLAAERPAAAQQLGEHVPVAHRGGGHLDPGRRPSPCGSRSWSSPSRPRRRPAAGRPRAGGGRRAPSARRRPPPSPLRSTASTRSPSPSKAKPTS